MNPTSLFPAGLRVVVVDDDPICLRVLEQMLKSCEYEVTKCRRAEIALKLLRDNKGGFDVVISDVHMPDMDGFGLLEHIGLEMDVPVVMMSADDSQSVVMKGVLDGACDYLIKPVCMEALKNIWQHVVRRKKQVKDYKDFDYQPAKPLSEEVVDCCNKKRKDEEEEEDEECRLKKKKERRVVWTVDLKQQFVSAVEQLGGPDKAVPNEIVKVMKVPGVTRANIASHLQKYRLYLKKLSRKNSFMQMTSYNIDQQNLFGYDNSKIRFVEGQVNLESNYCYSPQPSLGNYSYSQMGGSLSLPSSYGINSSEIGVLNQGTTEDVSRIFESECWGSSFQDESNRAPVQNQEDLMSVVLFNPNQESFGFP